MSLLHKFEKFKLVIKLLADMVIKELFLEFYLDKICLFYLTDVLWILY